MTEVPGHEDMPVGPPVMDTGEYSVRVAASEITVPHAPVTETVYAPTEVEETLVKVKLGLLPGTVFPFNIHW